MIYQESTLTDDATGEAVARLWGSTFARADGGFGGILGVGRGSDAPPRLVELTWSPKDPQGHVALVGKGITFDSGGLSIKPAQGMTTMKCDMSGAAAVAAGCCGEPRGRHAAPNGAVNPIADERSCLGPRPHRKSCSAVA